MGRKRQSPQSRIIKAAWNLFYKNGYEGTTINDIIAASKTSKGTFYHYFTGKDALLNTLAYLLDDKYEELTQTMDPDLSACDKLLFLNHELFYMIETSIDLRLLALLYSSQLTTRDTKSLLDKDRYYFTLITQIIAEGKENGEFPESNSISDLVKLYTMYERSILYDWALCKGDYSLTEYSDRLLPHVLDKFKDNS